MTRIRYRIRFAKTGLLRWTSHHDLLRLWERMLRRVALPLSMSEGFHPKPRLNFVSALALGIPGENEVVEVDLCEDLPEEEVATRLRDDAQPGLTIHSVRRMPDGAPKAQLARTVYAMPIPAERRERLEQELLLLKNQSHLTVQRDGKELEFELSKELADACLIDDALQITLNASRQTALRPSDVYHALGLADLLTQGACLTRLRVELHDNAQEQEQEPS